VLCREPSSGSSSASSSSRVERNTISGRRNRRRLPVATRSEQNVIADNSIGNSGDDGIDIDVATNTLTANSVHHNADWGIEAVAGTIDGGANRAWSNGQPAQCLNVVCGPGPPASLSLSPEDATNTVGDEHCVTGTVTDPDGRATPGVTVRFAVNDDGTASVPTDAGGTATYCYEGPIAPREDEISAYADDDGDAAQDAGEPGATASKSWVLPEPSERCAVMGIGSIVASNGDGATFRVNVHVHKDRSRGSVFYETTGASCSRSGACRASPARRRRPRSSGARTARRPPRSGSTSRIPPTPTGSASPTGTTRASGR
jgi:hypothetical protein